MKPYVCFANVFSILRDDSNINYKIRLYPGLDLCVEHQLSNACLFSKSEIRNHLLQLKSLYPFSYKVVNELKEGKRIIAVHLHLNDVPATFHKYILTWVRYLYEYPYNMILRDAYWLSKDSRFRFTSIATLFNLVAVCQKCVVGEGHSIREAHLHTPITKAELKERIRNVQRLNDIYEELDIRINKLPLTVGYFSCSDIEYWSKELFDKVRKPVYVELYNKVKRR